MPSINIKGPAGGGGQSSGKTPLETIWDALLKSSGSAGDIAGAADRLAGISPGLASMLRGAGGGGGKGGGRQGSASTPATPQDVNINLKVSDLGFSKMESTLEKILEASKATNQAIQQLTSTTAQNQMAQNRAASTKASTTPEAVKAAKIAKAIEAVDLAESVKVAKAARRSEIAAAYEAARMMEVRKAAIPNQLDVLTGIKPNPNASVARFNTNMILERNFGIGRKWRPNYANMIRMNNAFQSALESEPWAFASGGPGWEKGLNYGGGGGGDGGGGGGRPPYLPPSENPFQAVPGQGGALSRKYYYPGMDYLSFGPPPPPPLQNIPLGSVGDVFGESLAGRFPALGPAGIALAAASLTKFAYTSMLAGQQYISDKVGFQRLGLTAGGAGNMLAVGFPSSGAMNPSWASVGISTEQGLAMLQNNGNLGRTAAESNALVRAYGLAQFTPGLSNLTPGQLSSINEMGLKYGLGGGANGYGGLAGQADRTQQQVAAFLLAANKQGVSVNGLLNGLQSSLDTISTLSPGLINQNNLQNFISPFFTGGTNSVAAQSMAQQALQGASNSIGQTFTDPNHTYLTSILTSEANPAGGAKSQLARLLNSSSPGNYAALANDPTGVGQRLLKDYNYDWTHLGATNYKTVGLWSNVITQLLANDPNIQSNLMNQAANQAGVNQSQADQDQTGAALAGEPVPVYLKQKLGSPINPTLAGLVDTSNFGPEDWKKAMTAPGMLSGAMFDRNFAAIMAASKQTGGIVSPLILADLAARESYGGNADINTNSYLSKMNLLHLTQNGGWAQLIKDGTITQKQLKDPNFIKNLTQQDWWNYGADYAADIIKANPNESAQEFFERYNGSANKYNYGVQGVDALLNAGGLNPSDVSYDAMTQAVTIGVSQALSINGGWGQDVYSALQQIVTNTGAFANSQATGGKTGTKTKYGYVR